jgi:hypothetical protein
VFVSAETHATQPNAPDNSVGIAVYHALDHRATRTIGDAQSLEPFLELDGLAHGLASPCPQTTPSLSGDGVVALDAGNLLAEAGPVRGTEPSEESSGLQVLSSLRRLL